MSGKKYPLRCSTGERAVDYNDYLSTEHWKLKRTEVVRRYGYRCACCGEAGTSRRGPDIHHITYDNMGDEPPQDLIPLCQKCHSLMHQLITMYEKKGFSWLKASYEANKYLIEGNEKNRPGKLLIKEIKKRKEKKKKDKMHRKNALDRLNNGIGCAKGSQLRYIPNEPEELDTDLLADFDFL
jgi:hypothetical protein